VAWARFSEAMPRFDVKGYAPVLERSLNVQLETPMGLISSSRATPVLRCG